MNAEKTIKNSIIGNLSLPKQNAPEEYADRGYQYMEQRFRFFAAKRAKYANNYFPALEVQGLTEDFYAYRKASARLAEVSDLSAAATRKTDDFMEVLFDSEHIDYIPIGAKIKAMGSVWISVNPQNIANSAAATMITRCNSSYGYYDEYGNPCWEPVRVENWDEYKNENWFKNNMVLPEGNYRIIAQLNDVTRRLRINQRISLGTRVFYLTGVNDFMQEFSGDRDSAHLITFTARLEETTEWDDVKNGIADGLKRQFYIKCEAPDPATAPSGFVLTPNFYVDGEIFDGTVQYKYHSSDPDVATVDEDGSVSFLKRGTVSITITLAENENVHLTKTITVTDEITEEILIEYEDGDEIAQYGEKTFIARFLINGSDHKAEFKWTFAGKLGAFMVEEDPSESAIVTVKCLSPGGELKITASANGVEKTVSVLLTGI